jgi:hypothetical protein
MRRHRPCSSTRCRHASAASQRPGDFTHYENFTATTEASGHALDYDSRFPKMIKAYARIMRFIIDKALTKAQVRRRHHQPGQPQPHERHLDGEVLLRAPTSTPAA